jgi:hypothetical protein
LWQERGKHERLPFIKGWRVKIPLAWPGALNLIRFLILCALALLPLPAIALGDAGTTMGVTITTDDVVEPVDLDDGDDDGEYLSADAPNQTEDDAESGQITDSVNQRSIILDEKDAETLARSAKDHNPAWAAAQERSAADAVRAVATPMQDGLREKMRLRKVRLH